MQVLMFFCTNAIYIHIHNGEYAKMYIMLNGVKTFMLTNCFLKKNLTFFHGMHVVTKM